MSNKRGKRPGLQVRSKNGRKAKKASKHVTNVLAVVQAAPRITLEEREELYQLRERAKSAMHFQGVEAGAPREGALVVVKLRGGGYRYGMVLLGRFAAYEYHQEEYVTFAHPDRITHWLEIIPPVDLPAAKAEAESPQAQAPMCVDEAIHAAADQEADFQSQGEMPDRAEDVYA